MCMLTSNLLTSKASCGVSANDESHWLVEVLSMFLNRHRSFCEVLFHLVRSLKTAFPSIICFHVIPLWLTSQIWYLSQISSKVAAEHDLASFGAPRAYAVHFNRRPIFSGKCGSADNPDVPTDGAHVPAGAATTCTCLLSRTILSPARILSGCWAEVLGLALLYLRNNLQRAISLPYRVHLLFVTCVFLVSHSYMFLLNDAHMKIFCSISDSTWI